MTFGQVHLHRMLVSFPFRQTLWAKRCADTSCVLFLGGVRWGLLHLFLVPVEIKPTLAEFYIHWFYMGFVPKFSSLSTGEFSHVYLPRELEVSTGCFGTVFGHECFQFCRPPCAGLLVRSPTLLGVSQPCARAAVGWHNLKLCVDGGASALHSRIWKVSQWRFAVLQVEECEFCTPPLCKVWNTKKNY